MAGGNALHGCIPILVTPFADDGSLDLGSLEREIDWVIAEGAAGVGCVAIASEGYKLTEDERDAVIQITVRHVNDRVPVVASADGPGEDPALARAQRAARLGADALMVLPPYFVKPGPDALVSYYARIAEMAHIPIMLQDAPQLTGVAMTPSLWARMAETTPGLRYIKAEGLPQGPTISETLRLCGDRLGLFCGWGGLSLLDALERGGIGNMPAPNFTRLFAEVQRLWESGDRAGAERLFDSGAPFVMWTMQSIDHSVTTAKTELHRRESSPRPACANPPLCSTTSPRASWLAFWIGGNRHPRDTVRVRQAYMPIEARPTVARHRIELTRSAAMRLNPPRSARRSILAGLAVLGIAAVQRAFPPAEKVSLAQDATPAAVATPAPNTSTIQSTGIGAVPSTGGTRPGPVSQVRERITVEAIAPVGLTVEAAGIDAGIEALRVVNGAMQDPTGPWIVAWYENLGALGLFGNIVMAGHIDYWNVGPSVFYNLSTLQPGDEIVVSGEDGKAYPYAVEWVQQFDSTSMPLDDVIGPTDGQALTLITCGGAFDYTNGQYLQRTVVRANRSGPAQPITA